VRTRERDGKTENRGVPGTQVPIMSKKIYSASFSAPTIVFSTRLGTLIKSGHVLYITTCLV